MDLETHWYKKYNIKYKKTWKQYWQTFGQYTLIKYNFEQLLHRINLWFFNTHCHLFHSAAQTVQASESDFQRRGMWLQATAPVRLHTRRSLQVLFYSTIHNTWLKGTKNTFSEIIVKKKQKNINSTLNNLMRTNEQRKAGHCSLQ